MIIKTLTALTLGIKAGAKVTNWLMKDDIKKGKEILKNTPYIKDIEFQSLVKINTLKEKELEQDKAWYKEQATSEEQFYKKQEVNNG